jgi:hypothetical protein
MSGSTLHLTGSTLLGRALCRTASVIGHRVVTHAAPGWSQAVVWVEPGGADVVLPPDDDVPWAIVDHAVDTLVAACSGRPHRVDVVALAPAAWVCGPATAGPVDAVRIGPARTREVGTCPISTRLFSVQHTRCWVLACTFVPEHTASLGLDPSPSVMVLDDALPADTAAIAQFLHDKGLGDLWSGLYLAAPVDSPDDGCLRFVALCTEADWVGALFGPTMLGVREDRP